MTRGEAIINLKLSQNRIGGIKKEEWNALQMAIEALSQPIVAKRFDIQSGYIYCSPQDAENVKVVVRCKDCRYFDKNETWSACTYWSGDPYEQAAVEDNDYCSRGERR